MPLMKSSVFAYGFRPHFLLAGVAAVLLVPLWASSYVVNTPLGTSWPPTLWHAHEMLFGFVATAIAGFLLTAVPGWTGQRGFAGRPLMLLACLWLAARLLISTSGIWPPLLVAAADLAFLPALGLLLAKPLLRANNCNTPLLAVLLLLWLTDVVFHIALFNKDPPLALHALHVGIDITLLMVTVIGGRLVPAFTTSALRARGMAGAVQNRTPLTMLAVASMVLVALADVFVPDTRLAAMIAAIACAVQAIRLLQWAGWRTLQQPIVWILHLSYGWLPVGLALKAVALLTGAAFAAFWLHALTIGALTTMIVAVMTRASLGHTGRPLVVEPLIALAYLLLTVAAVIRVFGLSGLGLSYPSVIVLAALCWTIAFLLFLIIYAPILWQPRVDGKPG
jgi:uncharacterized protein involved in response to NO